VKLDIRVISATHKDLPTEIDAGRFRQDLYFRLNGITLEIPPLRARPGAISTLAAKFLADAAGGRAPKLGAAALSALSRHDWPGNVRELRLAVHRRRPRAPPKPRSACASPRWPGCTTGT
jgi:DNA-binding NtrC family response regulator